MRPLAHSFMTAEITEGIHGNFWELIPEVDTGCLTIRGGQVYETYDDAVDAVTEFAKRNKFTVTILPEKRKPKLYESKRICRDCKSILSVATSTTPDVVKVPCPRGCDE